MSERSYSEYGIKLTYRDSVLKHIGREDYKATTDKHQRALLVSLRDRAKRENWAYEIIAAPSNNNLRSYKDKPRLHHHVMVRGTPGATIMTWIKDYWRLRYGIAGEKRLYDWNGYIGYVQDQGMFIKKQSFGKLPHI